jgi:rhodanese-related sulfurtransferase
MAAPPGEVERTIDRCVYHTGMLTPDALADLMAGDTPHAVLDVRERGAYERGHVFRSTSLPRRQLETRLPGLVTAPATPIAVLDADGTLAPLAAATITAMGYEDVRVLDGGLATWRKSGRPVVQGVNVPSKVFGERALHQMKTPQIPPHELARRIERGDDMVIVDARTVEEYTRGCIPGAVSVPGAELVPRIAELVERPETTIVVHCGGRTRSYIGAESLRRMRLPNPVVALENGTMGWELAGLTLERGATRSAPAPGPRSRALAETTARRVAVEDGLRSVGAAYVRRLWADRARRNVYLVDVRTSDEYAAGHVEGAVWAPGGQAVQATDDYFAVRGASFVFVCDGGARAVMTAAWFQRMGFPDVAVLTGGLPAWREAGGAVETGHPTPAPFGWEAARAAVPRVTPGDVGDALILDVGPSDAYARGHVPGAAWICRSRLEARIADAARDRARRIVVTCPDGVASTLAAATLRRLGYAASVLDGGTRGWSAAGRPLESGATRMLDETDDVVLKPYERGREAMEAYLRWEEALLPDGVSPHALLRDQPARS